MHPKLGQLLEWDKKIKAKEKNKTRNKNKVVMIKKLYT